MRREALTNTLLAVIAVALVAIALRPYIAPQPAHAESQSAHEFYFEPGVQLIRQPGFAPQVTGKVVVDLRTGRIWGFPIGTLDSYPSDPINGTPVNSRPILLGRYALDEIDTLDKQVK